MPRRITVISPCFNERNNVRLCHEAVARVFREHLPDYELEHIFADNASTDGTIDILRAMASEFPAVKVIVNARNYGPFRSTFNALRRATGDATLVMLAVDLQDPPELIPEFVRLWEQGYAAVYGIRANREEGFLLKTARRIFYRVVNRFSDVDIPVDAGEFQLVDRRIVEAITSHNDYYPYLRGMIAECGFRRVGIEYTWAARRHGFSKNRLHNLIDQALNGIISYSATPMRMCLFAGFILAGLSLLWALYSLIAAWASPAPLAAPGIPTLIVGMFFFAGIQIFLIGLVGEYIAAIHTQVRRGISVLEQETMNFDAKPPAS